jgi:hypothetical protein
MPTTVPQCILVAPNFDYLRLDFCPQKLVRTDEISSIMLSQKYDNASFFSFPIDKVGQWCYTKWDKTSQNKQSFVPILQFSVPFWCRLIENIRF